MSYHLGFDIVFVNLLHFLKRLVFLRFMVRPFFVCYLYLRRILIKCDEGCLGGVYVPLPPCHQTSYPCYQALSQKIHALWQTHRSTWSLTAPARTSGRSWYGLCSSSNWILILYSPSWFVAALLLTDLLRIYIHRPAQLYVLVHCTVHQTSSLSGSSLKRRVKLL